VHAAEPAGREHADAGGGGQESGAGDGRGAAEAEGRRDGQVADAELGEVGVGADAVDLLGGQAHVRDAVQHRDRRRHRAARTDGGLDLVGRGTVVRPRQAVGEQGALQRHDGPAGAQRVGDLRGEDGSGGKITGRGMHPVIMEGSRDRLVTPG
jgi:hypothetical protein